MRIPHSSEQGSLFTRLRRWLDAVPSQTGLEREQARLIQVLLLGLCAILLCSATLTLIAVPLTESPTREANLSNTVTCLIATGLVILTLLTGLTGSVPPLLIYAAMAGIFSAGVNLVLFDISLATVPPDRVASYIALYQLTTYVATLVAPLLGTTLAGWLGYAPALFISAGLRLAGARLAEVLNAALGDG